MAWTNSLGCILLRGCVLLVQVVIWGSRSPLCLGNVSRFSRLFIAPGDTEEFDRFAQTLGSALPNSADLLTCSSATVVPDGDIEVAERSEQDSMEESVKQEAGESVTPTGKVDSYGKRELIKKRMAGVMKIGVYYSHFLVAFVLRL